MRKPTWSDLLDDEAAQVAALLAEVLPSPLHTLGLDGVRDFAAPQPPTRTTAMAVVREHLVGEPTVRVREYRPVEGGKTPAVLYVHGGGFTVGSLDGVDELCRRIAAHAECAVFSLEYRLAPENPYPAALDDVRAAWAWLVDNATALGVDPARMAVAGDSAPPCAWTFASAAATSQSCRSWPTPPSTIPSCARPGRSSRTPPCWEPRTHGGSGASTSARPALRRTSSLLPCEHQASRDWPLLTS
jgi:hypothetical protein